jgi:hypothetical protein
MEALNKKPKESKAGDRAYSALGVVACLGLFLVAVRFSFFDQVLLWAVGHLLP